jgi:hypothetical protein
MALKRAYLIVLLAFAWLVGGFILGSLLVSHDSNSASIVAYMIAIGGFMVGLIVGVSEVALAKGYSLFLGPTLALLGPLGLLIVELLPDRSGFQR